VAPSVQPVLVEVHLDEGELARSLQEDARRGLSTTPKALPPKWFYDERGSRLFERITHLPEYYPTRREREILEARAGELASGVRPDTLIELGSGFSSKTRLLLDAFAGDLRRFVPFDVSEPTLRQASEAIARELKRDVRERCGLVISIGVASNKLCAKIGSDLRKPDGLVIVPAGGEAAFLAPLPLERLWGVGPKTREVLGGWGLRTIGDLARFDRAALETRLGEHGTDVWDRAHGIDEGEVIGNGPPPKSVGHSHTFGENTLDLAKIESTLLRLAEGVGRRLRGHELVGRTVTLTLRVAPFETRTRQRTLAESTSDDALIYRIARQLLRDCLAVDREGGRTSPVRLVGVSVSGLSAGEQLGLFESTRHNRLNAALDAVRSRFGDEALDRASARETKERRRFSGHKS